MCSGEYGRSISVCSPKPAIARASSRSLSCASWQPFRLRHGGGGCCRGLHFTLTLPWSINATFISSSSTLSCRALMAAISSASPWPTDRSAEASVSSPSACWLIAWPASLAAPSQPAHAACPSVLVCEPARMGCSDLLRRGFAALIFAVKSGDWLADLLARLPRPVGPVLARIVKELLTALRAYWTQPDG